MSRNKTLALNLAAIVVGMLLLTAASVPLYRIFCAATGLAGTTQRASHAPNETLKRIITVGFNADVHPGLPWDFKPDQRRLRVHVGQQAMAYFTARNLSDHAITGRAVYNVTPFRAGAYFTKIQCFCFSNQTLAPGQKVEMPVVFYVDPAIMNDRDLDDLTTITLSYTFFAVESGK